MYFRGRRDSNPPPPRVTGRRSMRIHAGLRLVSSANTASPAQGRAAAPATKGALPADVEACAQACCRAAGRAVPALPAHAYPPGNSPRWPDLRAMTRSGRPSRRSVPSRREDSCRTTTRRSLRTEARRPFIARRDEWPPAPERKDQAKCEATSMCRANHCLSVSNCAAPCRRKPRPRGAT